MTAIATSPLLDLRFLLLNNLGQGGMGMVYRAFDRVREQMVALKLLTAGRKAGPAHPLSEEYRSWSRLKHPNIIRAYGLSTVFQGPFPTGTPYLVMESFLGAPVHQVLSPGCTDIRFLHEFSRQVLRALDHIHSLGMVHRDLKPGNVLVGRTLRGPGKVKLTDFGLAAGRGHAGTPGQVSGSLPYVAPESILGGPVDGRTDLYSLGILLFYLTTGRLPFECDDPRQVLEWHLAGSDADPRRVNPAVPGSWARFVMRLTARSLASRPASSAEALVLLGERTGTGPTVTTASEGDSGLTPLRLAIDAVRLGQNRIVSLPGSFRKASTWRNEIKVLACIHGLEHHALSMRPGSGSNLGKLVLEILVAREDGASRLVDKYKLRSGLPLELLGGVPLWDRKRAASLKERSDPALVRVTARGVSRFLLEASVGRSAVLSVERPALKDPLARETVRMLAGLLKSAHEKHNGDGGLLLLAPAEAVTLPC